MSQTIENLTNTLEISKKIVELAQNEGWSEEEFINAINLLHNQTKDYFNEVF